MYVHVCPCAGRRLVSSTPIKVESRKTPEPEHPLDNATTGTAGVCVHVNDGYTCTCVTSLSATD